MASHEFDSQLAPVNLDDFQLVPHDLSVSSGSICVLSGNTVAGLAAGDTKLNLRSVCQLQLAPEQSVVVGRAEGREVEYLDPAYSPTTIVPGTGQTVLRWDGDGNDKTVSRGHFMLRGAAGGILFVNGVPRRGGGIRPPRNGTWLLTPMHRALNPEEEYLIASGTAIVVWLPNGSQLRIDAA